MSIRESRRRVTRSSVRRVGVAVAAALVAGATSACTGTDAPTPRPTVEGPSFTTIPEGGGTVTVDRLEPPAQSPADVTRLLVSNADGLFWSGTSEPGRASPARAGQRYRLTGGACRPPPGARLSSTCSVRVRGAPRVRLAADVGSARRDAHRPVRRDRGAARPPKPARRVGRAHGHRGHEPGRDGLGRAHSQLLTLLPHRPHGDSTRPREAADGIRSRRARRRYRW